MSWKDILKARRSASGRAAEVIIHDLELMGFDHTGMEGGLEIFEWEDAEPEDYKFVQEQLKGILAQDEEVYYSTELYYNPHTKFLKLKLDVWDES